MLGGRGPGGPEGIKHWRFHLKAHSTGDKAVHGDPDIPAGPKAGQRGSAKSITKGVGMEKEWEPQPPPIHQSIDTKEGRRWPAGLPQEPPELFPGAQDGDNWLFAN